VSTVRVGTIPNFFAAAPKGGQEGGIKNLFQPTAWGKGKDSGVSAWVDPLGMFPQYEAESGQTATGDSTGAGSVDRYRNSEIVPKAAEGATTKKDGVSTTEGEDAAFGDRIHNIGKKQLGLRYEMNGDGVSSTDCGKFTLDTYGQAGVNLGSRVAPDQYEFCKTNGSVFNDLSQARPGDLVFFHNTYGEWTPGTITHVGIYIGNGKMLHAGSSNGVSYADLNSDYWQRHLSGFGRPRR
jgi:cell wall-associated NlpC family hydrolase